MTDPTALYQLLDVSAERYPHRVAVENPDGGQIRYRDLAVLSDLLRDRLARMGISRGDRVGIYLTKSIDAVAAIFGALKCGAAYVPVDPTAPASRNGYILSDCEVRAVVSETRFVEALSGEMSSRGPLPAILSVDGAGDGKPLQAVLAREQHRDPAPSVPTAESDLDDLAYILYTSGSTGLPKGVMLSHCNALSFLGWCSETFQPNEQDRFSSHAPFHFDLSILDIYLPIQHAATVVLIGHELGKEPHRLASLISDRRLTVWYSTPTILSLLVQYGGLSEHDFSSLRLILFAGEVFAVKYLRTLQKLIPHPRYFNLYGPTETNVCTFYEIPTSIPDDRTEPYPIGRTCSHLKSRVCDEQGREVPAGEEGELWIHGPAVMQGYWNREEQTAKTLMTDEEGHRWYRTGDLVFEDEPGDYIFRGRRDRMVKKRGYRVELGEIEACLYRHPAIRQAAVIALAGEEGVRIKAFVSTNNTERLSVIALKRFCGERLPTYMIPDLFSFHEVLPTTSTDKIDYQSLKDLD